jgi:hypothetical protein
VLFIEDCFPLLVTVSAPTFDETELRSMTEGFERCFARGEKYALVSVRPSNVAMPGPNERRRIAAWANHPRVQESMRRLCVGTAVVVQSPLLRAGLSVFTAIFNPAVRIEPVASSQKGIDYCITQLLKQGVRLQKPGDLVRFEAVRAIEAALAGR